MAFVTAALVDSIRRVYSCIPFPGAAARRVPELQRYFDPWRLFFPSALLLAPFNVLVWLALRHGLIDWPVAASAAWHGREMLFGYTFAVIAGYLLQALATPLVLLLWLLWLAGRLVWLVPPAVLEPWLELLLETKFIIPSCSAHSRVVHP